MAATIRPVEILIADDDPISRQMLAFQLESFGFRVQIACDGHETLAAYRDGADWIGLVILDARMPGPSPIQLYQTIRQIRPYVPVLFCSGFSRDDPVIRAINESGLQLLPKPFRRSDLSHAIQNALRQADLGPAAFAL